MQIDNINKAVGERWVLVLTLKKNISFFLLLGRLSTKVWGITLKGLVSTYCLQTTDMLITSFLSLFIEAGTLNILLMLWQF